MEPDETVEDAVSRELREETGVTTGKGYRKVTPQLLNVYSKPDRDPRMRVMSLAYVAVVNAAEVKVKAGDDAAEAGWFRINMTRTAINRESGVITYHLELTQGGYPACRQIWITGAGTAFLRIMRSGRCTTARDWPSIMRRLLPKPSKSGSG